MGRFSTTTRWSSSMLTERGVSANVAISMDVGATFQNTFKAPRARRILTTQMEHERRNPLALHRKTERERYQQEHDDFFAAIRSTLPTASGERRPQQHDLIWPHGHLFRQSDSNGRPPSLQA